MGYDPFQGDRPAQELWPTSRELPETPIQLPGLYGKELPDAEHNDVPSQADYREPAAVLPPGSIRQATVGIAKAVGLSLVLVAGVAFLLIYVGIR